MDGAACALTRRRRRACLWSSQARNVGEVVVRRTEGTAVTSRLRLTRRGGAGAQAARRAGLRAETKCSDRSKSQVNGAG